MCTAESNVVEAGSWSMYFSFVVIYTRYRVFQLVFTWKIRIYIAVFHRSRVARVICRDVRHFLAALVAEHASGRR